MMFSKVPDGVFHTTDVSIVYVDLWEGGLVSKLTHKILDREVFTQMKCFMLNIVLAHKLSESIAEPTTILRVNVELRL